MTNQQLGRLEEVDLRTIWSDEAKDFTPWLAEHLDELGAALHLDLQLREKEGGVGSFAVDIVAEASNGLVVIENQLERTDHGHLGQLLTYAAGRDARTLIWITPEFRDEHRAALDWLNRWTSDEIEAYGVEVRAVRIGNSLAAPEFRPVAFPNDWSRQSRGTRTRGGEPSNSAQEFREFYEPVVKSLHERGLTQRTTPYGYSLQQVRTAAQIDKAAYVVSLTTPSNGHFANVYLYLGSSDRDLNLRFYDALEEQRAEIEHDLGESLQWQRSRGYRPAISLSRPGSIADPPEKQKEVQAWMVEMLPKLKDVFEPRLLAIAENLEAEQAEPVGD